MKHNIKLSWYGGDSVAGYIVQFVIDGTRYEYETADRSRLDDICRIARRTPGKALSLAKNCCKYMGRIGA